MVDLNIDISEKRKDNNEFMSGLCDTFSLKNLITGKTFHKSKVSTSIDIILTNRPKSFHKKLAININRFSHFSVLISREYHQI